MPKRHKRLYSLFEKVDNKWVRLSPFAYSLEICRRWFRDRLLNGSLEGRHMALRPVKESNEPLLW